MAKRVQIAPHLSVEELEQRYRQASDGVERSHYQILWLLSQGRTTDEVAQITSYSRSWIYELVWGYNRLGTESLGDKRHQNPGRTPLLNDEQQAHLWQVLQEESVDGDLWDGPKVAQWMSELLGRPIAPQRGWDYLKALLVRRTRTTTAHQESDPEVQEAWKKNFNQRLRR